MATGHTLNDQAETFLLRLLRGAGPRGLGGVHPRAGQVIRPLLDLDRAELRAYLLQLGQPFRDDASNDDVAIPRNRIRHELLPLLQRDFSPGIVGILAREAEIARSDEDRLQREAIDLAGLIVLRSNDASSCDTDGVEVDADALSATHPALAGRVVRLAMETVAPGRFVGFDHIDRLLEFARDRGARGPLSLPGQSASPPGIEDLAAPARIATAIRELFSRFAVYTRRGRLGRPRVGSLCHPRGHSNGTLNRDTQR